MALTACDTVLGPDTGTGKTGTHQTIETRPHVVKYAHLSVGTLVTNHDLIAGS